MTDHEQMRDYMDSGRVQHAALDAHLARQFGSLEGRVIALERADERLHAEVRALSQQVTNVQSEQASARATREAQHVETMAQIGSVSDRLDALSELPGLVRALAARQHDTEKRIDHADQAQDGRTVALRLPEPTPRAVLAALVLFGTLAGIVLAGGRWPLLP